MIYGSNEVPGLYVQDVPGIGRVAFLLLVIKDAYPGEIKSAMALRNSVTLGAICECGAHRVFPSRAIRRAAAARGEAVAMSVAHKEDCPIGDTQLKLLFAKHNFVQG